MRGVAYAWMVAAGLLASSARADTSSWLAVGGGYGLEHNPVTSYTDRATDFSLLLGVGTTPRARFVVGGVFRSVTHFSLGTDVSLSARFATGGYARGDWGVALDLGAAARPWSGGQYSGFPLQGVLTLGAPWGLEVAVGTDVWNLAGDPHAAGGFALLEIDLLRLTVMRQGSTDAIWKNPSPAGGREGDEPR